MSGYPARPPAEGFLSNSRRQTLEPSLRNLAPIATADTHLRMLSRLPYIMDIIVTGEQALRAVVPRLIRMRGSVPAAELLFQWPVRLWFEMAHI